MAATQAELVHCYRLIFQVDPGGSRKAESFVAGTLAEVKQAALTDLRSGDGAYHILFYGEEVVLQCWEGPRLLASVDLHPFITYRIEGFAEPITFEEGDDPALEMDEHEELMEKIVGEEVDFSVKVDWAAIELPAPQGRPVRKGESVTLEQGRVWEHGFHSHWDAKIDA